MHIRLRLLHVDDVLVLVGDRRRAHLAALPGDRRRAAAADPAQRLEGCTRPTRSCAHRTGTRDRRRRRPRTSSGSGSRCSVGVVETRPRTAYVEVGARSSGSVSTASPAAPPSRRPATAAGEAAGAARAARRGTRTGRRRPGRRTGADPSTVERRAPGPDASAASPGEPGATQPPVGDRASSSSRTAATSTGIRPARPWLADAGSRPRSTMTSGAAASIASSTASSSVTDDDGQPSQLPSSRSRTTPSSLTLEQLDVTAVRAEVGPDAVQRLLDPGRARRRGAGRAPAAGWRPGRRRPAARAARRRAGRCRRRSPAAAPGRRRRGRRRARTSSSARSRATAPPDALGVEQRLDALAGRPIRPVDARHRSSAASGTAQRVTRR